MKPLNSGIMLNYNTLEIQKLAQGFLPNPAQQVHLFDRELGKQIRHEIEQKISSFNNQTVHYFDFKKICSIDFSCADELVGKLISRLLANEYGKTFFVLKNLNSNQQENIQVVLDRRKAGCLEHCVDSGWRFWGHRKNSLLDTLNVIMEKGEITARELCKNFGLELTTSSTRLSQLYKAYLVNRDQVVVDGGGMEYLYKKLF